MIVVFETILFSRFSHQSFGIIISRLTAIDRFPSAWECFETVLAQANPWSWIRTDHVILPDVIGGSRREQNAGRTSSGTVAALWVKNWRSSEIHSSTDLWSLVLVQDGARMFELLQGLINANNDLNDLCCWHFVSCSYSWSSQVELANTRYPSSFAEPCGTGYFMFSEELSLGIRATHLFWCVLKTLAHAWSRFLLWRVEEWAKKGSLVNDDGWTPLLQPWFVEFKK